MPRTGFLNTALHLNESELLGEMADFTAGGEKVQVQPEQLVLPGHKGVFEARWGQEDTGTSLKGAPTNSIWDYLTIKINNYSNGL